MRTEPLNLSLSIGAGVALVTPSSEQRLDLLHDFNGISSRHRSAPNIEGAADHAKAANWKATILTKRGSARPTDGSWLIEHERLPEHRALHVIVACPPWLAAGPDRGEVVRRAGTPRDDEAGKARHAIVTVHP